MNMSMPKTAALALSIALVVAACAAPPPKPEARAAVSDAPALATASGVQLHQPRPNLYTSGQPAVGDWKHLYAQGIKTVINLRPQAEMAGRDEAAEVRAAGLRYIEIALANADAITPDNARKLHEALGAAYQDGPVLLHCASANRAGGLLALAMVTEHGMSLDEALEIGRKAGMKSTEAAVRKAVAKD